MNRQERSQRLTLTLFFGAIVFITLIITLIITGLIVYFCIRWGLFVPDGEAELSSTAIVPLVMGLSLIIGTAISTIVMKIAINPIHKLISGMSRLSHGDYSARIKFGTPVNRNVVGNELAESFNILAEELENTEMLREDFINNFSHEFKTPIVSIAGFAKLLRRGNLSREEQNSYLEIIEEESMRLSYMATNVLNLTKVENQSILTECSRYNLSEQLRTCVLMLESKWVRKSTELILEFDEHMIYANEELMKQVWINLIDNAVKFSPEGGRVEISVSEDEKQTSVTVANTGQTIPKEALSKVFNKFYQAEESHASEGNGVGLAIVKRVAQLHKGSVSAVSENGFTAFTVSVPKQI